MAGCYDRPWRVGSKARGTRSQFRLSSESLLPFKCTYPVHLTDVMDVVPSTQSDLRRGEVLSPLRGTRTLAVREYEETIEELRKENFDLKLRIFLLEENLHKNHPKNKGSSSDDQDNTLQVVIQLKVEAETFKKELKDKDKFLQEALDHAEKYESALKELQDRFVELQQQLASPAKIPLEQEWVLLKVEKEKLDQETEYLRNVLSEKDNVIQNANAQIEELMNKKQGLEAKLIKRSKAIQGIVYKYHKDLEMIPKELRPIVQGAVQAARKCMEEDLNIAIEDLKASLYKIMPMSVDEISFEPEQKENKDPSITKTLNKELEKLPAANQTLEESGLSSRNTDSKTKFVHVKEHFATEVKSLSQSSESINESVKSVDSEGSENFEQILSILKDNETLKTENEEKARTIEDLNATCSELERRTIQLRSELSDAVSKVKLETKLGEERSKSSSSLPKVNMSVQTAVQWHLIQSKLSDSFLHSLGQSDKVDDLKEEILRLLLVIEQKDKEVSDIEQELGVLQLHLERSDNQKEYSLANMDVDNIIERNDLHQRLALSCQVNHELMEHLRKLEMFMEDLLQHKNLDSSSIENISETSAVLSRLTTCLDETKKLSCVLSDHLSVCESSKLFDPNDVSVSRDDLNQLDKQSFPADQSRLSLNASNTHPTSQENLRSYICKKCLSQSPFKEESTEKDRLQKVINDLSNKCNKQENQLNEIGEILDNKMHLIDTLNEEKLALKNFESENSELKAKLTETSKLLSSLQSHREELQTMCHELLKDKEEKESELLSSNSICEELKEKLKKSQESLENLQQLCSTYEKEINQDSEVKKNFLESLLSVKNLFLSNLQSLTDMCKQYFDCEGEICKDIDNLLFGRVSTTDNTGGIEELFSEFISANAKLEHTIDFLSDQLSSVSSIQQQFEVNDKEIHNLKLQNNQLIEHIESLQNTEKESKSLIKELKSKINVLQQDLDSAQDGIKALKKHVAEKQMHIENIQQSLKDSEKSLAQSNIKLSSTEMQFNAAQEQVVKCQDQLHLKDDENTNLQEKIMNLQAQLSEVSSDKMSILQQFEMTDKKMQSLKMENNQLNNFIKSLQDAENESRSIIKESKSKINFLLQDLDNAKDDIKSLKEHLEEKRIQVEDIQQSLINSEKFLEQSNIKLTSSEMQSSTAQKQVEKYEDLINVKDDEISKLQNKLIRLTTQLSEVSLEKMAMTSQMRKNSSEFPQGSVSFEPIIDNRNVSENALRHDVNSLRDSTESISTLHSSISSSQDEELSKIYSKYIRKVKSLKTKLSIAEKRIEILVKEKSDLREEFLAQVEGDKTASKSSEEINTLRKEISSLKEELKAKASFIKDLKNDMLSTCNSLIDKQKEVDDLKRKLSSKKELCTEVRSKSEDDLKTRYSDPLHVATETNIKMLKKHKWELVQGILSQQKQFYERKNIHLGHLEKFKNHIEKLRALQISPTLFKSESEPFLNSFTAENNCYAEKCDKTLKNLQIELELDVECLQNFQIFLKRFFIPLILQSCEQCSRNADSTAVIKSFVEEKESVSSPSKMQGESKSWPKSPTYEDFKTSPVHHSFNDRLITTASALAHKVDLIESTLNSAKTLLENAKKGDLVEVSPKETAAKSLLVKLSDEIGTQQEKMDEIFHLNAVLKSLGLFDTNIPLSRSKQDMSDRESLSEETLTISRSGSISPMSFEEHLPFKASCSKSESHCQEHEKVNKSNIAGGSQESIFLRSHFSSPDQGIESDPNHESSAPEQAEKEDFISKLAKRHESGNKAKQWSTEKQLPTSLLSFTDSSTKSKDHAALIGSTLHAIGELQHYELLKKEVQESLVGIKAVLSRTGDGLQHVAKFTSPRKNLEYSTFKAIRDTSGNIEVCLEQAAKLVDKFWIAPCPSVQDLNILIKQSHEQQERLKDLAEAKLKQECYFNEAMAKLKHAEILKEKMDKKISKKLVKTKKVIRQAEIKLLERGSQDYPPIPNFPTEDPTCQKKY